MLVMLAALIAVDAPPASYLANAETAADSGITADDIQEIMIAIAPVAAQPEWSRPAENILRALGFAIAVAESEMADQGDGTQ